MHRVADAALPELEAALDGERMRARVAHAAGKAPQEVAGCAIERVKYRPGRSALVLYRLSLEENFPETLVYATVYPSGVALRAFPEDRKLPGLRLLADPARLRAEVLPDALDCSVSRVSYFPEHAYTARVVAHLAGGRECPLYAKTQFTARGERTFALLQDLHKKNLRCARPLLYHAASATLVQEAVPGSTAESLAVQGRFSGALAARVGGGVAALHGAPVDALAPIDARTCLTRLQEVVRVLGAVLPPAAAQARKVLGQLEKRPPPAVAPATLHGDLHLNNILIDSGRVALVDLDDLCRGPAELELGSFVAALAYRAALHGDRAMHQETVEHFLAGYAEHAQRAVSIEHVHWYAAAALIHERAWRCLTSLKPGRLAVIDELIARAAELAFDPCLT
jgi:Ser/Thr protein kinase RdoA (MazF antagonist)